MGETRINSSANITDKGDRNVITGIAQSNFTKRAFLVAVVGAFTVFCFIYFRSQFEPSFDGKPLSYWLEEYNRAGAMEKMQPASKAIREIGTNALVQLAENLKQIDPPWKRHIYGFINKNPIYKIPFRTSSSLHGPTLWALQALGTDAVPIIPHLSEMLNERRKRWHGLAGLLAIGKAALPALTNACSHTNLVVRADAALILNKISGRGGTLHLDWSYNPESGRQIIFGGWGFGDSDIQALADNLKHTNAVIRRASADGLAHHSGIAKPAIPSLLEAIKDSDALVRSAAANAIKSIDPQVAEKAGIP